MLLFVIKCNNIESHMSTSTMVAMKEIAEKSGWARPIAKESLADRAHVALRNALMCGQLKPGEKLLLRPVSQRFGVSATPMREALLRLVSVEALVLDGRGTVVVPTLTHAQLQEIRSIRLDLEGRAAATAAIRAAPADIDILEAIHADIARCHERKSFHEAVDFNTRFHLTLCRIARLPILLDIIENLWVRCGPILSHLYDSGLPDLEPHPHVRVIAALRDGDGEGARHAIRWDIETGGKGLDRHVLSRE